MADYSRITSKENLRLKNARKIRDGKSDASIFLEGVRLAEEASKSSVQLVEAFISDKGLENLRAAAVASSIKCPVSVVDDRSFDSIADTQTSQGIILIAERPATDRDSLEQSSAAIYLHEVNDPSNIGAVCRTAEAAGVRNLILSKSSADVFSPKALRAGMGSNLRIRIWTGAELEELLDYARANSLKLTAADISGDRLYTECDWNEPRLICFGSEAFGLNQDFLQEMADVVKIPLANEVESLNLAVSAGIILFKAKEVRELSRGRDVRV